MRHFWSFKGFILSAQTVCCSITSDDRNMPFSRCCY